MYEKNFYKISAKTIADCLGVCADNKDGGLLCATKMKTQEPKIWISENGKIYDVDTVSCNTSNEVMVSAISSDGKTINRNLDTLNFSDVSGIVKNLFARVYRTDYQI